MMPEQSDTRGVIDRFNEVFNAHDVDGIMSMMTAFENTSPAPDGGRYEGQEEVRGFSEEFFASSPNAVFETEDMFIAGDRCLVRWIYNWGDGHIRGVDVFKVRDGKVAEKLSYVKG